MRGLEIFFFAFFELMSERSVGFSAMGRIPWSSKYRYGHDYLGYRDVELEDFFYLINKMEIAYDRAQAEKDDKRKQQDPKE